MLCHTDLYNYYNELKFMTQHANYTLTELEDMIPYEKYIFIQMTIDRLKQLQEQRDAARR